MSETLQVQKETKMDLLDTSGAPALSSTSDIPVVETKPDATNEGAPPAAAPDKDAKTPTSESATEPEETSANEPQDKTPARGVQKRLDELTRQREEAERRAKAAEENLRLALEGRKETPAPPKDETKVQEEQEPQRPKRADFPDPDAYDAALDVYIAEKASFTARKEVQAARSADEKARAEAQANAERQRIFTTHAERVEKAKTKYTDFAEVAEAPNVEVSYVMADVILTHEQGPDIQYHLGKNPAEAARIMKLAPAAQLMELGMLAASLKAPAAAAPKAEPAPAPKPLTAAPAPIKPAPAAGESTAKPMEEMSMDEYAAMRKPQLQGERRPGMRRTQ